MKHTILAAALIAVVHAPAQAQSELDRGLLGALRGCEEWVLRPASWTNGVGPFVAAIGLGNRMGRVARVEEVNLPPPPLRRGNQFWRINATVEAGYILVVSDQVPMCHITGGGGADLQPVVERVLASAEFGARWSKLQDDPAGDMASTRFRNRADPAFSIQISRAARPDQRQDRVQVIATATYN